MVSFIRLDLQHNGIQFHTTQIVSFKSPDMGDMGNKQKTQYNKQKCKMVKKTEEDVQCNEKRNSSLKQLTNCFVNRINEKNAKIMENNFPTPKRVAVISTFYKSEHNPRKTNLPEKDVKILNILANK